ncbi:MAG: hypothetical protein MN733_01970 [Nitrososphaera sp.]|nr:hypothetical protein [Nitrososphaera sp.]
MALQATLSASLTATLTPDVANDLEVQQSSTSYNPTFTFSNGTGNNQANTIFSDTRTLTASASETIDLSGSLTDLVCDLISLTALKFLIIRAHATNTNDVVFGPNSTNGFVSPFNAAADRVRVKPGGMAILVAPNSTGYVVTAGSADLLFVQNGGAGTSVIYDILFAGVDA